MFGSFLPSQWFSTNHSVLGSKEPTLLCNQVKSNFAAERVNYDFSLTSEESGLQSNDVEKRINRYDNGKNS